MVFPAPAGAVTRVTPAEFARSSIAKSARFRGTKRERADRQGSCSTNAARYLSVARVISPAEILGPPSAPGLLMKSDPATWTFRRSACATSPFFFLGRVNDRISRPRRRLLWRREQTPPHRSHRAPGCSHRRPPAPRVHPWVPRPRHQRETRASGSRPSTTCRSAVETRTRTPAPPQLPQRSTRPRSSSYVHRSINGRRWKTARVVASSGRAGSATSSCSPIWMCARRPLRAAAARLPATAGRRTERSSRLPSQALSSPRRRPCR